MKIMVFTEGTILMAKNAIGLTREEIVQQVKDRETSVKEYATYVPIGHASDVLQRWANQGAEIIYLTSRREQKQIDEIQNVLNLNNFPKCTLEHRGHNEEYKDVIERIIPDVFIEDDCESIGGEVEIGYPHIKPELKTEIKSIIIKEFSGIDELPEDNRLLLV